MTVDQWKWKYTGQQPLEHKSVVAVGSDGKIGGHWGGLPVRMWFRNRQITAYQAVDVMIADEYRGGLKKSSLYFKIGSYFYENIPSFVYGFANRDHLRLGRLFGFFEDCITVYDNIIPASKHRLPFYKLEPVAWDERDIDSLWDRFRQKAGWALVRDVSFLRWRYETNPFHEYKILGLRKIFRKGILGWLVIREEGDNLFVMDMICRCGYAGYLLKKMASEARAQGRDKVVLWLGGKYGREMISCGCRQVQRGTYLPNFIWERRCDCSEMSENFHYTMGDTDFL